MIHHLRISNIHQAPSAARSLSAAGPWYGFQIGPESYHSELRVRVGSFSQIVGLGETLIPPAGAVAGQVVVEPVRKVVFQADDSIIPTDEQNRWDAKAHLIAMSCPEDLVVRPAPKLRRVERVFTVSSDGNGPEAPALIVPFAGRSMMRVRLDTAVDSVAIYGALYDRTAAILMEDQEELDNTLLYATPDREVVLQADTALSATAQAYRVVDEYYDVLVVKVGDASSMSGTIDLEVY